MTVNSQQHADLSFYAYEPPPLKPDGTREPVYAGGVKYIVLEVADKPSGYQGVIFQREDTGEIVVAHRGTEFGREFADDVVRADGGMVAQRANHQAQDAIEFARQAQKIAEEQRVPISVTGHSLGGCLAQIVAARLGLRGETFNAYGAASLGMGIPEQSNGQVVNHVMAADFVSSASPHFGEVRIYASRHDIQGLQSAGYDNNGKVVLDVRSTTAGAAAGVWSHSLHNFRDVGMGDKPDISVLRDVEARVNAERFEPMIGKFRGDVGAAREAASVGAALMRGPMGVAEEIIRRLPEKQPESPFKDAHGALPAGVSDPREPGHRNHAMHHSIHTGLEQVYAQNGRPFGEGGERSAAALLTDAVQAGLSRVDRVVAGRQTPAGLDVFAVQGDPADPAHKRAQVNTALAEQVPVEVSFRALDALNRHLPAEPGPQSQQQIQHQARVA